MTLAARIWATLEAAVAVAAVITITSETLVSVESSSFEEVALWSASHPLFKIFFGYLHPVEMFFFVKTLLLFCLY